MVGARSTLFGGVTAPLDYLMGREAAQEASAQRTYHAAVHGVLVMIGAAKKVGAMTKEPSGHRCSWGVSAFTGAYLGFKPKNPRSAFRANALLEALATSPVRGASALRSSC